MRAASSSLAGATGVTGTDYVLKVTGAAAVAPSDLNENQVANITIPQNIGTNAQIRATFQVTYTNNANAKTLRVRYNGIGGSIYFSFNAASSASCIITVFIANLNAANVQNGHGWAVVGGSGSINGPTFATSAVDTGAGASTLTLTVQKASAGDTVTVISQLVEIFKPL